MVIIWSPRSRKILDSSIDFESLRYLSASADAGNFGRAAKILGVQTSTVSRKIARVEDELGVTLFERGHFGIRLTTAGKAMMAHVHRILADMEELRRSGRCNDSGYVGNIQLGVRMPPVGEPLRSLLSACHAHYPDVALTFHEMNERDTQAAMEERRLGPALSAEP